MKLHTRILAEQSVIADIVPTESPAFRLLRGPASRLAAWPARISLGTVMALTVVCAFGADRPLVSATTPKTRLPRWRDNSDMVFVHGGELAYRGRKVRVRSYYMDQYEVTNTEYCAFLNDGNGKHWNADQEIEKQGDQFVPKSGMNRWPVYAVSWYDADAYAHWARKRLPTGCGWPT